MDDSCLASIARYVERKPVKARMAARAENWPWSSARVHVDRRCKSMAESDWLADLTAGWVINWRQYLADATDAAMMKAIQRFESTGRPLGDPAFVAKLEKQLGRSLAPRKPGPKPKNKPKRAARKRRK